MTSILGRRLDHLSREECIRYLQRQPGNVGRIALAGPRPVILPVNYAVDNGEAIVFRSDPGAKLHAALHKAYVAFEIDWIDDRWRIGYSVLVRGQASVVTDPEEIERLERLDIQPWAAGDKDSFVRIAMDLVTGRRFE